MAVETAAAETAPARKRGGLSRRALLGTAAAGGAAVAAVRLLGINPAAIVGPRTGIASTVSNGPDWTPPLSSESARTLQLLRRAAFGGGPAEIERSLSDGFSKTLDRLLETKTAKPPALPGADSASPLRPLRLPQLQAWWMSHMVTTPTPLAERLTLFWHGHFTSDYRKVSLRLPYLYWQNQTWRDNALGDFRSFLYQVTVDPAMLRYLDLGTSTGEAPNENYARELMELFTMGAGTFTEDDVRAAAKALAGWREPLTKAIAAAAKLLPAPFGALAALSPDAGKTGVFVARRAYDGGPLTYLGKAGKLDTKGVLQRIAAQPATAPFVTGRLAVHFLMPNPPAATIKRLAEGFIKSGWSIKELVRSIFTSDEFASAAAYRSLVKSPVETIVHALRALGGETGRPALTAAYQHQSGMGQTLFDPPDVGGWPLNASWISSNTVLERVNFVSDLLQAIPSLPSAKNAHLDHLDGVLSPATSRLLSAATTDLERWTAVLCSPEFQLK